MTTQEQIKHLFRQSDLAQNKVELSYDGRKAVNPKQQAASTRLYNKAVKMCREAGLSMEESIKLHEESRCAI